MNILTFLKNNSNDNTTYLKLQFYVIEDNDNGFIMDARGYPLYSEGQMGLPWIGTEKMLPKQLDFIAKRYEDNYGKKLKKIVTQRYEGQNY